MRLRLAILATAFVPLLSGCSVLRSTMGGWAEGRHGLTRAQRELRVALSSGDFPRVLDDREDDAMLRVLTASAATFYSAQLARSAALLDTAALLADARVTTSLSRGAMSMVTNDMARRYQPRRTERLFIPYYGMLAYARLGDWEGAAVEARRVSSLLAQFADDRDPGEQALHASLHYLAGSVFERAGEREAAGVSYRNAHALLDRFPARQAALADGTGEVLVVVERGFVAHRVTETIRVALAQADRDSLRGHDGSRRRVLDRLASRLSGGSQPTPTAAPPAFQQRAAEVVEPQASPLRGRGAEHRADDGDDDDDWRDIRLAFPVLRRSPRPWAGPPRIRGDGASPALDSLALRVAASVDDASAVDERRERASIVTRELARAAAKYAVTRAVHESRGRVAGTIAEIGSAMLERADVRSWHLLPQEVVLLRVRLPAGEQRLRLDVGEGAGRREVLLEPVHVRAGTVGIVTVRLWHEAGPSPATACERRARRCGH